MIFSWKTRAYVSWKTRAYVSWKKQGLRMKKILSIKVMLKSLMWIKKHGKISVGLENSVSEKIWR